MFYLQVFPDSLPPYFHGGVAAQQCSEVATYEKFGSKEQAEKNAKRII